MRSPAARGCGKAWLLVPSLQAAADCVNNLPRVPDQPCLWKPRTICTVSCREFVDGTPILDLQRLLRMKHRTAEDLVFSDRCSVDWLPPSGRGSQVDTVPTMLIRRRWSLTARWSLDVLSVRGRSEARRRPPRPGGVVDPASARRDHPVEGHGSPTRGRQSGTSVLRSCMARAT